MKMLSVFLFTFDLDAKAEGEEEEENAVRILDAKAKGEEEELVMGRPFDEQTCSHLPSDGCQQGRFVSFANSSKQMDSHCSLLDSLSISWPVSLSSTEIRGRRVMSRHGLPRRTGCPL